MTCPLASGKICTGTLITRLVNFQMSLWMSASMLTHRLIPFKKLKIYGSNLIPTNEGVGRYYTFIMLKRLMYTY